MATVIEIGMDPERQEWCVTTVVAGDPIKRFWDADIRVAADEADGWARLYQGKVVRLD